jgi:hypothetical protein
MMAISIRDFRPQTIDPTYSSEQPELIMKTVKIAQAAMFLLSLGAAGASAADLVVGTSNDVVDGKDRWRSAAASASLVLGKSDMIHFPAPLARAMDEDASIEIRARAEIITSDHLRSPQDRLYVEAAALGFIYHDSFGAWRVSAGPEMVVTGETVGLSSIQSWAHQVMGLGDAFEAGSDIRIENGFHPTVQAEVARVYTFGDIDMVPFVDGMAGIETFARAGLDLHWGANGLEKGWVRDPVTGTAHPIGVATRNEFSWNAQAGADISILAGSQYFVDALPEEDPMRVRIRAGVGAHYGFAAVTASATWMSSESSGDDLDGQVVGAVQFSLAF